jgi:Glycosyl transferase family 2
MNAPLVSVVVAAWQSQPAQLQMALHSALAQSHTQLEIIVSDDSPDDRLRALVQALNDTRLLYQHNGPALGVARNHWACLRQARGDFVVVLNHDDWLAPGFVHTLLQGLMANPSAVLAFCDHWIINAQNQRQAAATERACADWGRSQLAAGLHLPFASLVVAQTIPMAMGTLFRRAALHGELPVDAGPAYDLWLTYLLCRPGAGAVYVPERLSAWRAHDGNLTSVAGLDWRVGAAKCWQAMLADPVFDVERRAVRQRAASAWVSCATLAWQRGRRAECARFARKSLRTRFTMKGLFVRALAAIPAWCVPAMLLPKRWVPVAGSTRPPPQRAAV